MSEHDQQVAVVEWYDLNGIPVFAIPNGGIRHKRTAAMLKAEGVKAGVPDLFNKQDACVCGSFAGAHEKTFA